MTKVCTRCKVEKALVDFDRRRAARDGHASLCKECNRARTKAYAAKNREKKKAAMARWRAANREYVAGYQRRWREGNADQVREYNRAYHKANLEERRAVSRQYYRENKDVMRDRRRQWVVENKERYAAQGQVRRLLRQQLSEGDLEYMAVLRADPCCYCGAKGGAIDHVVPLSASGDLGWENLTASCRRCNSSKSTSGVLAFLWREAVDRERQGARK